MDSTLKNRLHAMLTMQESLNSSVRNDWRTQEFAWHRAIYVEATEFLEHMGQWKWWSEDQRNLAAAHMELADIWHFGLSMVLQSISPEEIDETATIYSSWLEVSLANLTEKWQTLVTPETVYGLVDMLVAKAGNGAFSWRAFAGLLVATGLSVDGLYKLYAGKYALNCFRQQHGYRTGDYDRHWGGQSDERRLETILARLPQDEALPQAVLEALDVQYHLAILSEQGLLRIPEEALRSA